MRFDVRRAAGRLLAASLLMMLVVPLGGGRAHGQTGGRDAYVADAAGRSLRIVALGQQPTTLGFSQARISSALVAKSTGAGQLLSPNSKSEAEVSSSDGSQRVPDKGRKCGTTIPVSPPLLEIGIACSQAEANINGGLPGSKSVGQVLSVDVNASSQLNQVIKPIQPSLEQAFGALPASVKPATDTVKELLSALGATKTLAVRLGDAVSETSSSPDQILARSTTEAGHIDILPVSTQFGEYFIRIEIGSAKAEAIHNRATGGAASTADPAIVRVLFAPNIAGQKLSPVVVAPGNDLTLLAGTPLETTIKTATSRKFTLADGSVGAVADAVTIHALKGVSGGVQLELAHAEAVVAGTPLRVTKVANPKSVPVGNTFLTTITIENPYECEVQNVRVDDQITVEDGARFKIVETSPKADEVTSGDSLSQGTVLWKNLGTIPPKQSKQVTVLTLAQGNQDGKIIDIATASGSLGNCPATAQAGTEVAAAALNQVPVAAVARLEVPVDIPRTGASDSTTTAAGLGLIGIAGAGIAIVRRLRLV